MVSYEYIFIDRNEEMKIIEKDQNNNEKPN